MQYSLLVLVHVTVSPKAGVRQDEGLVAESLQRMPASQAGRNDIEEAASSKSKKPPM